MFYRLSPKIALRRWKYVSRAIYLRNADRAIGVKQEDFDLLLLCDGHHDLDEASVKHLLDKGYIEPCKEGEEPSSWSKLKEYDNYYFPQMNLMITGKCNLNCLHCFNAKDNAPLNSELSYEEVLSILDQARDIGTRAFTITGGEPLVHKRFLDIIRAIYERDMIVFELNTNGLLITQEMLDEFKKIGCDPLIKISYDGVGYHNWMRQSPLAEEKTIAAIKLCIANGFDVKAQTQVHRKNVDAMLETVKLLDSLGVGETRIIRTTEAPRWEKNSPDTSLPIPDYYERMLEFAKEYIATPAKMRVDIWQFLRLDPSAKTYRIAPVACSGNEFSPRLPVCKGNRGMIAVTSSGDVVPCLQMSGYFIENGLKVENLRKNPLKDIIFESEYTKLSMATLLNRVLNNEKCASCKYFKACAGGCPALGLLTSGDAHDYYHEDVTKCYFFENGWYEKVTETLSNYGLTNPLKLD